MSQRENLVFGKIALNKGYISQDILSKAVKYLKKYPNKSLESLLAEKRFLSQDQIDSIHQIQDQLQGSQKLLSSDVETAVFKQSEMGIKREFYKNESHQQKNVDDPFESAKLQRQPMDSASDGSGVTLSQDGNWDMAGASIGGCQIIKKIGEGGMAAVYLAHHDTLNKKVVIKVLPKEASERKRSLDRFLREARAAARLEHPSIVGVHNVDKSPEGVYYIVMQYVDGKDLKELVTENGAFEWKKALNIMKDVASGLLVAHQNDVIHRDIKAENIMLTNDHQVKVTDFGLAKDLLSDDKLTAENAFIGTPLYMAPEIGRVSEIDGRVDIFSLGITFYYILTGVLPLKEFKTIEIMSGRAHDMIRSPLEHNPEIPEDLCRVLGKMIAKNRDERYKNAADLLADIMKIENGERISTPFPKRWVPQVETIEGSLPSKQNMKLILGLMFLIIAVTITVTLFF